MKHSKLYRYDAMIYIIYTATVIEYTATVIEYTVQYRKW